MFLGHRAHHHLYIFKGQIELYVVPELARCQCFAVTLKGVALKWFQKLPTSSITSWA